MSDIMDFANREEFRKWLSKNCLLSEVMPLPIYQSIFGLYNHIAVCT